MTIPAIAPPEGLDGLGGDADEEADAGSEVGELVELETVAHPRVDFPTPTRDWSVVGLACQRVNVSSS